MSLEWVRRQREECRDWRGEVKKSNIEVQEQKRFKRVQRLKWNRLYKEIRVWVVPKYLREKGKKGG